MKQVYMVVFVAVVSLVLLATSAFSQGMMRGRQGQAMGDVPGLSQYPLSSEQRQQIAQIRQQTQVQMREIRANPNLMQSERNQRIAELQAEQHSQVMNVLTPAQREEFSNWWQNRQAMGPGMRAGAGPGMGRGQGMMGNVPGLRENPLTNEQRQQIAQIRTETHRQVREIMADPNLTTQQKQDRISTVQWQSHDRIVEVMTPAQRQEFTEWWRNHPAAGRGTGQGQGMGTQ